MEGTRMRCPNCTSLLRVDTVEAMGEKFTEWYCYECKIHFELHSIVACQAMEANAYKKGLKDALQAFEYEHEQLRIHRKDHAGHSFCENIFRVAESKVREMANDNPR